MRIVYLNPCGKLGGAETSLRELLASVHAAAPEWELCLLLAEDGPLVEIARAIGVQVVLQPFPPQLGRLGDSRQASALWKLLSVSATAARYSRSLRLLLRQLKPDIIHSTGFKMQLLSAWTRPHGIPLVWHIHDYVGKRPLMSRLLRLFASKCTLAIANSKSVARDIEHVLPRLRVKPIYNAIDLDRFSPTGAKLDLDAAAGLPPAPPGTIRVGLVATFARWKGHKVFLEALARIAGRAPVRGYIIGGPIYQTDGSQWSMPELRKAAEDLGLGSDVGFTGFLNDTALAMRSLEIIVHASTEPEPFGMVIVEGMACGKPVIASQAGGAEELFIPEVDALGHVPGDAGGLAERIVQLARDAGLRERLGQAGRAKAERLYQGRRLAQELMAIYRDLTGAAGKSGAETVMQPSVPAASD